MSRQQARHHTPEPVTSSGTASPSTTTAEVSNQAMIDALGREQPEARTARQEILSDLRMATGISGSLTNRLGFIADKLTEAKELLMTEWSGELLNERDELQERIVQADAEVVDTLATRAEALITDESASIELAVGFPRRVRTVLHELCPPNPTSGYPSSWSFSQTVKDEGITRVAQAQSDIIQALQARGEDPDAILAEVQLGAAETAEEMWEDGDRTAGPFREAAGTSGDFDWCGMFTVSQYSFAGLDGQLRSGFWQTGNVQDFFDVGASGSQVNAARVPLWIDVTADSLVDTSGATPDQDGRLWMHLAEYHAARGSQRSWLDASQIASSNIRPGDAVLCGADASNPTHIAMVHSVPEGDTFQVITIEGNASGIVHLGEEGAGGPEAIAETTHTEASELEATTAQGVSMNQFVELEEGGLQSTTGHHFRLAGRGRPSLVDFEAHDYAIAQPSASQPANQATGTPDV